MGSPWPWPWPWLSGLLLGLVLGLPVLDITLVTAHPPLLPDAGWCSRKHPVPQIGRKMEILCKERHTICTLKNLSHSSIPKSRVKPIDQSHHQQSLLKEHFTGWPIKNGTAYFSQYVEAIISVYEETSPEKNDTKISNLGLAVCFVRHILWGNVELHNLPFSSWTRCEWMPFLLATATSSNLFNFVNAHRSRTGFFVRNAHWSQASWITAHNEKVSQNGIYSALV